MSKLKLSRDTYNTVGENKKTETEGLKVSRESYVAAAGQTFDALREKNQIINQLKAQTAAQSNFRRGRTFSDNEVRHSPITAKSGKSAPSDNFKAPSVTKTTPVSSKTKIKMHYLATAKAKLSHKSSKHNGSSQSPSSAKVVQTVMQQS